MSNDNEQHSEPSLSEELSALQDHFLPDGVLIKGVETLSEMKDKFLELDGALSELARTANLSATELRAVTEEAFRLGDAAGRTEMETLSYIASAIQAGHNLKDAFALTEEALKMANLSPGIDSAGTAIEHMQGILDGFGENTSFAATINDTLTGISQAGTVDLDTLAAGASKLAESAADAGMSFEEMLGLLSGAYQRLGDMDKVTSGETAIFSHLKETYGDAKNIYSVLEELSSAWDTLDDSSRDSLAASIAGTDQTEVFAALMDNWNGVEQAVFSASNSFGIADEANKTYLDSFTGKTASLQNQLDELSTSLVNSDLLEFFLNLGTAGTDALNGITDKLGSLGTLGALAGGYLGAKNLGRANTDSCPSL